MLLEPCVTVSRYTALVIKSLVSILKLPSGKEIWLADGYSVQPSYRLHLTGSQVLVFSSLPSCWFYIYYVHIIHQCCFVKFAVVIDQPVGTGLISAATSYNVFVVFCGTSHFRIFSFIDRIDLRLTAESQLVNHSPLPLLRAHLGLNV